MFVLEVDTSHYSFRAYGASKDGALAAFKRGWAEHVRQTGADPDYCGSDDDLRFMVTEVALDTCYRDGSPIPWPKDPASVPGHDLLPADVCDAPGCSLHRKARP